MSQAQLQGLVRLAASTLRQQQLWIMALRGALGWHTLNIFFERSTTHAPWASSGQIVKLCSGCRATGLGPGFKHTKSVVGGNAGGALRGTHAEVAPSPEPWEVETREGPSTPHPTLDRISQFSSHPLHRHPTPDKVSQFSRHPLCHCARDVPLIRGGARSIATT